MKKTKSKQQKQKITIKVNRKKIEKSNTKIIKKCELLSQNRS